MARIQTRKGKSRTTFTATVRIKGFTPVARTFDTKGEAKSWAADIEKEMRIGRYQDVRPAVLMIGLIEPPCDRPNGATLRSS